MNPEILKKLLQYEPEPPAGVWKGISKALDENISGGLSGKLQNYEAVPPAGTWEKIAENLTAKTPGKIIKRSKFFTVARVAAAASVIIIMAASIIFWNRDEDGMIAVDNPVKPVQQQQQPQQNSQASAPVNIQKETDRQNFQQPVPSTSEQRKEPTSYARNNPAKPQRSYTRDDHAESRSFIPEEAKEKAIAVSSYPVEKYMVYSDEDGNAMRVPKKLFEIMSCVKEEILCQQQVQQLQSKFASYVTSNDFTGLMEMLRNMKENK